MLTYRSDGRGATIVPLHAFPLYSAFWEKEAEFMKQYARVITPDLPGFGFSPRLKTPSLRGMAEELGQLLKTLEIREPVILGGLSMGGYVAFEFFRLFPERVNALMLFSTRAEADTPETREKRMKTISEIKTAGLDAFAEKITPQLLGKHTRETQPRVAAEVAAMISRNKLEGVTDALYAIAMREDSSDLLPAIQCPALIVAGEEDEIIPAAEMKKLHEKIAGSEFHKIPKAGHLVNLEKPEAFRGLIFDFIKNKVSELSHKTNDF